jgi:hypothetical protein
VPQGLKEPKVQKVFKVLKEVQVLEDSQVLQVLKEVWDLQGLKVLQVS